MSNVIARHDTVIFELHCNWFNELFYIVQDVMADAFESIEFSRWDGAQERAAYERAARFYNSLVPADECIPLF